ncbi:MAG TPA: hypothetical protein VFV27_08075 [Nevskiaceae bacterium]|nr:hypothetical protein [Nevskiaceae bacterium]
MSRPLGLHPLGDWLLARGLLQPARAGSPFGRAPLATAEAYLLPLVDARRLRAEFCAAQGLAHPLDALPALALERLRQGQACALLDLSNEGLQDDPALFEALQAELRARDLPAGQLLLVTQNQALEAAHRARDPASRLGFAVHHALLEQFARFAARQCPARGALYPNHPVPDLPALAAQLARSGVAEHAHAYGLLVGSPRYWRLVALCWLAQHGLLDQGLIHFDGLAGHKHQADLQRFTEQLARNRRLAPLVAAADRLRDYPRFRSSRFEGGNYNLLAFALRADEFESVALPVVLETEMSAGGMRRHTEKLLKPLLAGRPLLVLGNPGCLAALRGLGFATFSPVLEEGYDEIADPTDRALAVLEQLARWCGLSAAQRRERLLALQPVVQANQAHLLGGGLLRRLAHQDTALATAIRARLR